VFGLDCFILLPSTGLAAAAVVTRVERRIDLLQAGLILSLGGFLVLAACGLLKGDFPKGILADQLGPFNSSSAAYTWTVPALFPVELGVLPLIDLRPDR
jgi:hypothetical protein